MLIFLNDVNDLLCDFKLLSCMVKENVIIGMKIGWFIVIDEDKF